MQPRSASYIYFIDLDRSVVAARELLASSAMAASGWINGKVKAVPSGDTLVIMGRVKAEMLPPEKSITLSSIIAPRLVS